MANTGFGARQAGSFENRQEVVLTISWRKLDERAAGGDFDVTGLSWVEGLKRD